MYINTKWFNEQCNKMMQMNIIEVTVCQ